jgi:NAD(P)-dependent dehydrogenase (short-subunit alcohol dehydrogenase family)
MSQTKKGFIMKTVLITGAGRGIGFALAQTYLQQGDRVIATYRTPEALHSLQALSQQGDLTPVELEVTDTESIEALAKHCGDIAIDILINNAGVFGGEEQSLTHLNTEAWKQTLAINTIAPIELTLSLLPNLRLANRAKVISISSMMASLKRNQPNHYAYRSSKAALNKAMQCLAHDLQSDGVTVCPVHPGWVQTDMGGEQADISVEECVTKMVPMIEKLSIQDTGKFWQYDGQPMDW